MERFKHLDQSTPVFDRRFSAMAPATQTPPADLLAPSRPTVAEYAMSQLQARILSIV